MRVSLRWELLLRVSLGWERLLRVLLLRICLLGIRLGRVLLLRERLLLPGWVAPWLVLRWITPWLPIRRLTGLRASGSLGCASVARPLPPVPVTLLGGVKGVWIPPTRSGVTTGRGGG